MSKDPAEAVAALAKILEGWAAMQEHQGLPRRSSWKRCESRRVSRPRRWCSWQEGEIRRHGRCLGFICPR